MIESLITWLQAVILPLGASGVFLGSLIEEIIAFIPSAMVQMTSGFIFFAEKDFTWQLFITLILKVSIPASLGVAIGSLFIYGIAYYIGEPALEKYGKYIGFSKTELERFQKKFAHVRTDELFLFITRVLPIIPSVVPSVFAGLIRMPVGTYLFFTFMGTLIRATFYGFIGWRVGAFYMNYAKEADHLETIGLMIIIVGFIGFVLYHKYKKTT